MIIKKRKQVYELTKSMNNNTKKIKEIKEQISKLLSQDNKDNKEEVKDLRKNINELLSENLKIKSELTKLNKQIVEAEYIKEEEQNAYSHFAEYMNNTNEREKEQAQARSIRTASIKPRTRKITNISSLFMRNEPRSIPIIEPRSKPKPRTRKRRGNVVGSILHIS
jgi:regulator of replication initiation timing